MENDLISREAAIAQIERRKPLLVGDKTVAVDAFIKFLKNRPAVDAAPVRYEHWDENGRCTGCGNHAPFWCMASTYYLSPYCQHCGARMDGDKNAVD